MPFFGRARLAPVADPIDRALRDRDEPLVIAVDHEHMALAGRLIPSRINQLRARNQRADDGRAQVIDLVFPVTTRGPSASAPANVSALSAR